MTTSVKIYHNPKCSKSRSALELIQQKQLTVEIIEYLKFPPHSKELADIIKKLGVTAREIIRKNEEPYKRLGLSNPKLNESELLSSLQEEVKNFPNTTFLIRADQNLAYKDVMNLMRILNKAKISRMALVTQVE